MSRLAKFVVDIVALRQVSLPTLQFPPVSIISPMLYTHSFTYHRRYIIYNVFLQVLQFPLSVSFYQCSILIHSTTNDGVSGFSPSTPVSPVSIFPPMLHTHFSFSHSVIPPMLHTHSFICYLCCVI